MGLVGGWRASWFVFNKRMASSREDVISMTLGKCGWFGKLTSPAPGNMLWLESFSHHWPISTYSSSKFLLKTFLHSNLHFQFVHSSFIQTLHSHDSYYPAVFCSFSVSVIISMPCMSAWVKHKVSTFTYHPQHPHLIPPPLILHQNVHVMIILPNKIYY